MAHRGDGKETEDHAKAGVSCLALLAALALGGVCVAGILAAIAIPAFTKFRQRTKVAKANYQLEEFYLSAAEYYAEERLSDSGAETACTVDSARTTNTPSGSPTPMTGPLPVPFRELGLSFSGPTYYEYEIVSASARCGHEANEAALYTFRALGDLDDDGVRSTFELTAHSDAQNVLVRSPGIHSVNELE